MAILAALHHVTRYRYARPARLSPQVVRLRPAPHSRTRILSYSQRIEPAEHFINWLQDPQSNYLARLVFPEPVREFSVTIDLVAEMAVINPFDFFLEPYAEEFPFTYAKGLAHELDPFLPDPVDIGPLFAELAQSIDLSPQHSTTFLVALNQRLQRDIAYRIRMEPGVQTPEETLHSRSGSCRDSAWLLVNLLRHLGLAARFVSGYLIQLAPDEKSLDGPSGPEKDFTDLHAWAEVYLPGAGWIGLDPTSGLLADAGHIPLACSPEPTNAAPITGLVEDVETDFTHEMSVQRIRERPRVTKPYSDEAWKRVDALGQAIDKRLAEDGVNLTMGGEPTFISIDDMDGPEWNTAAVGPAKRRLSEILLQRLQQRFAPDGFLHYGQGKWYPGESLPRWAFSCYWRTDGQPLWRNRDSQASIESDYGHTPEDAQRFLQTLADTLEVGPQHAMPAYEDPWYFLWKEQRLPSNVDATDSRLKDPEERTRLARVFEKGLATPRGWVLPLQRQWQSRAHPGWISGPWYLRQRHLFLIPGDSPIGLRLPLESLPWVSARDYPYVVTADPTVAGDQPLPDWEGLFQQYFQRVPTREEAGQHYGNQPFAPQRQKLPTPSEETTSGKTENSRPASNEATSESEKTSPPAKFESARNIVRTALTVEARDGKLFVFMPPLESLEDYIDLLAAIEATATRLQLPVLIEGDPPPSDHRLESFSVTPDPGVIEVNIHPSRTWDELVDRTTAVYEEARQSRLGTDKFMLDGRHTGTGGGNHFVLGGATPLESPFLRRPDLLRSMIAYWHQHPSLSYFFSGLFIGATSQSPRLDEGRHEALYELELAFAQIDRHGSNVQPWLVDRIFRHLLTDLTGNTHRAEFCIDKLYSPDSSSGRRGLLELRSFEMPPHARMSLAQQLLLRALVAWFWRKPFKPERLTRWGTQLQDKFMLPHVLWNDLRDVLRDLRKAGFPIEEEWFEAHYEFRFPLYGVIPFRETSLEVRHALEPWHVLGEEGAAGGTVRFVDSSVERLQIKATNLDPERYTIACNGHRLPLQPTATAGTYVAGLRYRAWQPPSCLHPTIPVDTPLHIDLVDTHNQRAVSGCTYHVAHPAGRNYEQFPVNSWEAESRRLARFEARGHTPGPLPHLPPLDVAQEYPWTLDLRRFPKS